MDTLKLQARPRNYSLLVFKHIMANTPGEDHKNYTDRNIACFLARIFEEGPRVASVPLATGTK